MLSRQQIKTLGSLRAKKNRREQQQFLAEGETIVAEILQAMPEELLLVACDATYYDSLAEPIRRRLQDRLIACDERTLRKISSLDSASPVLAVLRIPEQPAAIPIVRGLALYLDGIRDPGNLGTILRVADWFGMPHVYATADCVDAYNPKAIQAGMGAFLRVSVITASLPALRQAQPDLQVIGTRVTGGSSVFGYRWQHNNLLVIGSESHGIRENVSQEISNWVSIPSGRATRGAESLNAAVATGILCAAYQSR